MAYDGFQHSSDPYSHPGKSTNPINMADNHRELAAYDPPYPYQPTNDQLNMPQPQMPPSAASAPVPPPPPPQSYYPEPPREQASWPPPSHSGRINDAVTSAVGNSGSPSYLSQDLVAQITASVIQQLGAAGINSGINSPASGQNPYPQPPPPQWGTPQPPIQDPNMPQPPTISQTSPSPSNAHQPPQSQPQSEYPSASHLHARLSPTPPQERKGSPSQYSDQSQSRPKAVRNDTFPTTLEKIWGKLFDEGKPTPRLGELLRGLATHLIDHYPPENTLVVVPEKLQKFYADTNIPSDPYPWQDIFDDRTSSISRLFREVKAEHHLVQAKLDERPDIPGLTPRGFEVWATLMIQANPDRECERLQKAVLNMPISNPDNRKERFPKEIPRRLFPELPNLSLREELDQFIMKHTGVDLPPITDDEINMVAAQRHKSTATPSVADPNTSLNNRERKPHHSTSTSAVVDDDDDDGEAPAIERKRKPYTAQPGGGKVYEGPGNRSPTHRHANSFSTNSSIKEVRPAATRAPESPPPYRNSSRGPNRGRSNTTSRPRSQSRGFQDYRHSESDLLNGSRHPPPTSTGDYYYNNPPSTSNLPSDLLDQYRELDRSAEDQRLYEQLREREKEREKSKYHDTLPSRTSWAGEEDYYRGMLGGGGAGGASGSGYDYKSYR